MQDHVTLESDVAANCGGTVALDHRGVISYPIQYTILAVFYLLACGITLLVDPSQFRIEIQLYYKLAWASRCPHVGTTQTLLDQECQ
jgi:hypothetical protein